MTQETDHTQALMDFLYLVFEVEPEEGLVGEVGREEGSER
jgi:hypothetical protein